MNGMPDRTYRREWRREGAFAMDTQQIEHIATNLYTIGGPCYFHAIHRLYVIPSSSSKLCA